MAPYQHQVMATKTSTDSKPTSQTESTVDSTFVNHGPYGVQTKDEFDEILRLEMRSPNAIQKPLIESRAASFDVKQTNHKTAGSEATFSKNREAAFKFYNRGGPALQQMLSQRKRLPRQSTSYGQHSGVAPRSKSVSDMAKEEAFEFNNRGGQPLQQALDHSGRTPRQPGSKGTRSATAKRDVDAEPTVSKHALETAPPSEGHLLLHNGSSVRIPEIEIQGFKRVMSSPKVVNITEDIPTHITNARYEMNHGNATALNSTIDGQAAANHSPAWKGLEVFGLVLLGIVALSIIMSSISVHGDKRKEKRKRQHEAEVIAMERLARLRLVKIGVEDLGGVMYSVDLNEG